MDDDRCLMDVIMGFLISVEYFRLLLAFGVAVSELVGSETPAALSGVAWYGLLFWSECFHGLSSGLGDAEKQYRCGREVVR